MPEARLFQLLLSQIESIRDDARSFAAENHSDHGKIMETVAQLREDVSAVKTRSKMWGALAGGIVGAVASIATALAK